MAVQDEVSTAPKNAMHHAGESGTNDEAARATSHPAVNSPKARTNHDGRDRYVLLQGEVVVLLSVLPGGSFARAFNWNAKMHSFADFIDLRESAIPAVRPTIPFPLQYGYRSKITPHLQPPPKKGNKMQGSSTSEGWKQSWLKIDFIQTGKRVVMDTEVAGIGLYPNAIRFATHNAELDALVHEVSFRSGERRADLQCTALVVGSPRKGCDAFVRRLPAPCADARVVTYTRRGRRGDRVVGRGGREIRPGNRR
ncbi:hypothetical protein EDB89DRAFT_1905740 [Lactarius sanguifluus]|nr:hypothetical protein EDB89DRAFT_1905740 [Lactarius sanguifluus]